MPTAVSLLIFLAPAVIAGPALFLALLWLDARMGCEEA